MTDAQKDHNRLVRNLWLIEGGRSSREMAEILNISAPTYCKKRKCPELLTYAEIKALCRNAKVRVADFTDNHLALRGEN